MADINVDRIVEKRARMKAYSHYCTEGRIAHWNKECDDQMNEFLEEGTHPDSGFFKESYNIHDGADWLRDEIEASIQEERVKLQSFLNEVRAVEKKTISVESVIYHNASANYFKNPAVVSLEEWKGFLEDGILTKKMQEAGPLAEAGSNESVEQLRRNLQRAIHNEMVNTREQIEKYIEELSKSMVAQQLKSPGLRLLEAIEINDESEGHRI